MLSNLGFAKVKEFTIVPKNRTFYLKCSYKKSVAINDLDFSKVLGIDLGTSYKLAILNSDHEQYSESADCIG
jgi:hypothetical protein